MRNQAADQRDRIADQRDRMANQRDRIADQRERKLDEREARAEGGAPPTTTLIEQKERRRLETVGRIRARVAATAARGERNEALIRRVDAETQRVQTRTAEYRAATEDEANRFTDHAGRAANPDHLPRPKEQALRRSFVDAALKVAEVEEWIARLHQQMASERPDRATACRHIAEEALTQARRAREIVGPVSH
jgi:hypothetical protein